MWEWSSKQDALDGRYHRQNGRLNLSKINKIICTFFQPTAMS